MQIDRATDTPSLGALGDEAFHLLSSGDIHGLARRFGYALAFDREPAMAIEKDLRSCLTELGVASLPPALNHTTTVKYFAPNDTGLFAVVECVAVTNTGATVFVELIVTNKGEEKHITLEGVRVAA